MIYLTGDTHSCLMITIPFERSDCIVLLYSRPSLRTPKRAEAL